MSKFLAVLTALVTIVAALLGIASYLGSESAERYHLVAGLLALVLVLLSTHRLYHNSSGENKRIS